MDRLLIKTVQTRTSVVISSQQFESRNLPLPLFLFVSDNNSLIEGGLSGTEGKVVLTPFFTCPYTKFS